MITIISATNRPGSNTRKIALAYQKEFAKQGIETTFLDLEWLENTTRNDAFTDVETKVLIPTEKFVLISPEYNGTFSGVLKLLIDISEVGKAWHSKKAMLTGVASGRAGNLRGLDQLSNVCNHLKMNVLANKLPISSVHTLLNEQGALIDAGTEELIANQVKQFIAF